MNKAKSVPNVKSGLARHFRTKKTLANQQGFF